MSIEDVLQSSDIIVTAINFHFDGIELNYMEKRKNNEYISVGEVMFISILDEDYELLSLYGQFQELATGIIERGFTDLRNPPSKIDPKEERDNETNHEEYGD